MSPEASPASQRPSPDWTVHATETIESVVGAVRDKATIPLRTLVRAVVYGIALAVVAIVAAVLFIVAAIRFLAVELPVGQTAGHRHRVWVAYVALGGIFTLAGLFMLRKAEATPKEGE